MKKITVSLFALLLVVGVAHADSVLSVAQAKAEKAATIGNLQSEIQRHEAMTKDQILDDLAHSVTTQSQALEQRGLSGAQVDAFQTRAQDALNQMKSLDKDSIVAIETADLQRLQSSDDYVFFMTRTLALDMSSCDYEGCIIADEFFWLPIVIVADIAIFPFELLGTLATGA